MNDSMTPTSESEVGQRKESGHGPADGQPPMEVSEFLKAYAREKPDVVALWCFGLGFVLGWKLKPW